MIFTAGDKGQRFKEKYTIEKEEKQTGLVNFQQDTLHCPALLEGNLDLALNKHISELTTF